MKTLKYVLIFIVFIFTSNGYTQLSAQGNRGNTIYKNYINCLSIYVENTPCESIKVESSKGKITGTCGEYKLVVNDTGEVELKVSNRGKEIGRKKYRIKELLDPFS